MSSFFNNIEAKIEVERLYHEKLDDLAFLCEFMKIETSFGNTNIIQLGNKNKPPLVLLHGSNGCAPVAIEAMIDLANQFNIYAIDVVGQPNLSAAIRPEMKDESYGQWMYEILSRLNIWNVIIVGISFGGFICWKTLTYDERRISRAFLIVPAGIINGNPLAVFRKVFLPMKLYQWRKKAKYINQFLNALFSEHDKFASAFLSKVLQHFEMDFSQAPLIKKDEAQQIKTPISIIAADNDLLFPGKKLLKRAKNIFPSLNKVLLLSQSKHVPNYENNKRIVQFIKEQKTLVNHEHTR